jgi:hypothetical protein
MFSIIKVKVNIFNYKNSSIFPIRFHFVSSAVILKTKIFIFFIEICWNQHNFKGKFIIEIISAAEKAAPYKIKSGSKHATFPG